MSMTKTAQIQTILEHRIRHGDYLLTGLPAERELSLEVGVSRMTTRKAIERLVKKGLLYRQPNGRVAVSRDEALGWQTFSFLVPSTSSGNIERWRLAIETAASDAHAHVRTILYVHWDDPILLDAIENFDGTFLFPSGEEMPARIISVFVKPDAQLQYSIKTLLPTVLARCACFRSFLHRGFSMFLVNQAIEMLIASTCRQLTPS
jgi:DNA-binding transcriptional regulator YhcF (GntR family)